LSTSDIERTITAAAERALEISGNYFKDFVGFHLKSRFGMGLEIVTMEPEKFHEALSTLVGEYSTKVLENLIVQILLKGPSPVNVSETSFGQIIGKIKNRELRISE
jgi:hypothetical protein